MDVHVADNVVVHSNDMIIVIVISVIDIAAIEGSPECSPHHSVVPLVWLLWKLLDSRTRARTHTPRDPPGCAQVCVNTVVKAPRCVVLHTQAEESCLRTPNDVVGQWQ